MTHDTIMAQHTVPHLTVARETVACAPAADSALLLLT